MNRLSRRAMLAGLAASWGSGACSRRGPPGVVRVGYLANLSHGPMLAGVASGRIERLLGSVKVETRAFRAGPRVIEALLGGAVDVGVSGPAPVVIAHARQGAGKLRILSGCASGAASFVVTKGSAIGKSTDLRGRALATVQIGSTQDIALRKYLHTAGLETKERGGDVTVSTLAAAAIHLQMLRGELDGAWLPEPWPTRAVMEIGASRLVDERDLWPRHAFPSALLVSTVDYVRAHSATLEGLVAGLRQEVAFAASDPARFEREAYDAIKSITGNAGPRPIFHAALERVDFTSDPMPAEVGMFAADACALGLVPRVDCGSLFRRS